MSADRDLTERGVHAVAAAVWDSAKPVREGVRPPWATVVGDPAYAAGVGMALKDARTAFDAAAVFVEDELTAEFRRVDMGSGNGWRPVRRWESVDGLLGQGVAVQQRVVGPWLYVDDGTNGKGFIDA